MQLQNDIFKFVFRPAINKKIAFIELTMEPYSGMVIMFGKVDIHEYGYKFDYAVLENPNAVEFHENIEFHKYLERVLDILFRERNSKNERKANSS